MNYLRTNADDSAMPISFEGGTTGLTKREFFAAMAIASGSTPKDAVAKADALMAELNKE